MTQHPRGKKKLEQTRKIPRTEQNMKIPVNKLMQNEVVIDVIACQSSWIFILCRCNYNVLQTLFVSISL